MTIRLKAAQRNAKLKNSKVKIDLSKDRISTGMFLGMYLVKKMKFMFSLPTQNEIF